MSHAPQDCLRRDETEVVLTLVAAAPGDEHHVRRMRRSHKELHVINLDEHGYVHEDSNGHSTLMLPRFMQGNGHRVSNDQICMLALGVALVRAIRTWAEARVSTAPAHEDALPANVPPVVI